MCIRDSPQSEKFFLMAASIHDMIAAIVPYGQQDRLVARSAAAYYMISLSLIHI